MKAGPYFLDLSRVVHIWFSNAKDVCLPELNKLRLIQKRLKNPHLTMSLVYSSDCLSHQAVRELESFAEKCEIRLIDFDTTIRDFKKNSIDTMVYTLAKKEILRAANKTGGNMAAASDLTRLLNCVLSDFGNYVDFDVDIDFSHIETLHSVRSPFIIPSGVLSLRGMRLPVLSNHFLGLAVTTPDDRTPHPIALECIQAVKKRIIDNYHGKNTSILVQEFTGMPSQMFLFNPQLGKGIVQAYSQCGFDIMNYRAYLLAQRMPESLRQELYRDSVLNITGPQVWYSLFPSIVERFHKIESPTELGSILSELCKQVEPCGYMQNGLEACILSKDNISNLPEEYTKQKCSPEQIVGVKCDQSWTPLGAHVLNQKSSVLKDQISRIQAASRGFLVRNELQHSNKNF